MNCKKELIEQIEKNLILLKEGFKNYKINDLQELRKITIDIFKYLIKLEIEEINNKNR